VPAEGIEVAQLDDLLAFRRHEQDASHGRKKATLARTGAQGSGKKAFSRRARGTPEFPGEEHCEAPSSVRSGTMNDAESRSPGRGDPGRRVSRRGKRTVARQCRALASTVELPRARFGLALESAFQAPRSSGRRARVDGTRGSDARRHRRWTVSRRFRRGASGLERTFEPPIGGTERRRPREGWEHAAAHARS
jgi:hypothetical protein